jgi:hypothetical protein
MKLTNEIKRTFLSFAQLYFRDVHPTLTWNVDPRRTKIFIADKNVNAPASYEKSPSIILSRGTIGYAQTSIDQMQWQDKVIYESVKKRTDLVRGSITYNCISSVGVEAEEIANCLFTQVVGFKDQFRKNGIHQIMGISMGEEQIIRGDAEPRAFLVPVNIQFTAQVGVMTIEDMYYINVYTDDDYLGQIPEDGDDKYMFGYVVIDNELHFNYAPSIGTEIKVDYTGMYTLNRYSQYIVPSGLIDGSNTIFPLGENIYTPYYTYSGILIYASGVINFTD